MKNHAAFEIKRYDSCNEAPKQDNRNPGLRRLGGILGRLGLITGRLMPIMSQSWAVVGRVGASIGQTRVTPSGDDDIAIWAQTIGRSSAQDFPILSTCLRCWHRRRTESVELTTDRPERLRFRNKMNIAFCTFALFLFQYFRAYGAATTDIAVMS